MTDLKTKIVCMAIAMVLISVLFFLYLMIAPVEHKVAQTKEPLESEKKNLVGVEAITVESNLPESYQVYHVPYFGFDRYEFDIQNGADFIARTMTNYYEAPGLSTEQSQEIFQHSSNLVYMENFFRERGYEYFNYDLEENSVEEMKQLLHFHEGPIILMGQKLYSSSYFLGNDVIRTRIVTGYDDNAYANTGIFNQEEQGVFYVNDLTLGYQVAIPYSDFVDLNSRVGVRAVFVKPKFISQAFINKTASPTPYPERIDLMKNDEILLTKITSTYISDLSGQNLESRQEELNVAREVFFDSPVLEDLHIIEVFDRGFEAAVDYQIQGNTKRAFEVLRDYTVPFSEPEMITKTDGEWGPIYNPSWSTRHIDSRIFLALTALSLEENDMYAQMRTEIAQFTGDTEEQLSDRLRVWIDNAPTYRLDNVRPLI